MKAKLNTKEIIMLIPDYITGEISSTDKTLVEKALKESLEVNELYLDMKSTMGFINSVKQAEPEQQYWNSLLHRIHEKIEVREYKGFSWEKFSTVWKVLVPVAAVIFIALVYYIVKPSNTQLAEDKKIEIIINDSTDKQNVENKYQNNTREQENNFVKENENTEKNIADRNYPKSVNFKNKNNENLSMDVNAVQNIETPTIEFIGDEQFIEELDFDETAILATGTTAVLDEDTENELKKLNNTEKDKLLNDLINSNL